MYGLYGRQNTSVDVNTSIRAKMAGEVTTLKTITVSTLEGTVFTIKFDSGADNCWSCLFPHVWAGTLESARKFHDQIETWADGSLTFYCGSLNRLMDLIVNYISESEA